MAQTITQLVDEMQWLRDSLASGTSGQATGDVGAAISALDNAVAVLTGESGTGVETLSEAPYAAVRSEPGPPDNLTLIRGISSATAYALANLGITRFAHISGLTAGDVEQLGRDLGYRCTIHRDNWIEQAAVLATGGTTRFSRRDGPLTAVTPETASVEETAPAPSADIAPVSGPAQGVADQSTVDALGVDETEEAEAEAVSPATDLHEARPYEELMPSPSPTITEMKAATETAEVAAVPSVAPLPETPPAGEEIPRAASGEEPPVLEETGATYTASVLHRPITGDGIGDSEEEKNDCRDTGQQSEPDQKGEQEAGTEPVVTSSEAEIEPEPGSVTPDKTVIESEDKIKKNDTDTDVEAATAPDTVIATEAMPGEETEQEPLIESLNLADENDHGDDSDTAAMVAGAVDGDVVNDEEAADEHDVFATLPQPVATAARAVVKPTEHASDPVISDLSAPKQDAHENQPTPGVDERTVAPGTGWAPDTATGRDTRRPGPGLMEAISIAERATTEDQNRAETGVASSTGDLPDYVPADQRFEPAVHSSAANASFSGDNRHGDRPAPVRPPHNPEDKASAASIDPLPEPFLPLRTTVDEEDIQIVRDGEPDVPAPDIPALEDKGNGFLGRLSRALRRK